MSPLGRLARALAALALTAGLAAPPASAQRIGDDRVRGERILTHDRHKSRRGEHSRKHRAHSHSRHDRRRHARRDFDRRKHYSQHRRGHDWRHRRHTVRPPVHHLRRDRKRAYKHHYRHHSKRPYYSYRPYKPRVRYHAPRYVPRYRVGGHYGYGRHTVVIRDYRRHGLYHPPRGYHWVRDRDRGDAILCSVTTGAIIGLVVGALSH
ncbi:MAG: hypothetical protein GVY06_03180 [Alphaproteobacteria bacterium]|jgi:Ni/Co efflux regulator RcnB|nr:hypothetical protein [Alphaproteobacteria bacterium]